MATIVTGGSVAGGSGSGWTQKYAVNFGALDAADLSASDTEVTIDGAAWDVLGSANAGTLELDGSSGLVIAQNSNNIAAISCSISALLTDLDGSLDPGLPTRIFARVTSTANADFEHWLMRIVGSETLDFATATAPAYGGIVGHASYLRGVIEHGPTSASSTRLPTGRNTLATSDAMMIELAGGMVSLYVFDTDTLPDSPAGGVLVLAEPYEGSTSTNTAITAANARLQLAIYSGPGNTSASMSATFHELSIWQAG